MTDNDLLLAACKRAIQYLESVGNRNVFPTDEALRRLSELDVPLPERPTHPTEVLRILDEIGSPATVASAGPRYFGFVIGGSLPVAVASSWLATAWDQNAGLYRASPIASVLDRVALRWVVEALALPADWDGGFVTGTTMAHVTALAAARHHVLAERGWDVERDGLFGAPPITVIAGAEAHATLFKALNVLGIGGGRTVLVPADTQGRLDPTRIPRVTGPVILCAQAGNVDTGAVDPLPAIVDAGRTLGAWVHVDGAFGVWGRAAPSRARLLDGLDGADSCATDLHKWLNVPYDNGLVLLRGSRSSALRAAMAVHGAYLTDEGRRDVGRHVPDFSRRARGVDPWAALLSLGRSGLADLIERTCAHARQFASGLQSAGYEILNDVVLNQVLVAFGSDAATLEVVRRVQSDGTCWLGATTWHGRAAMRISVSSWATTESDAARSLDAIVRVARGVVTGTRP